MTKVMTCTCKHAYQDKKHGQGRRVHNPVTKASTTTWRCTVCAKEKT